MEQQLMHSDSWKDSRGQVWAIRYGRLVRLA